MPTPPLLETKRARLDLTSVEPSGTFEGYASLFHVEDLSHDVIAPGAFRDTLAKRGTGGIRMLYQHDPNEPIGIWEQLAEDGRGLKLVRWSKCNAQVRDQAPYLERGNRAP